MMHYTCVLICFSVFLCVLCKAQINNYPVIGIFTQPSESNDGNCRGDCLMLAASYVKQVESSGARVVPVNYYASDDEIKHLFSSLNGFIFPGGGAGLPPAAQLVYDLTIEANDNSDFMPLWGTCLGFEWLLMCTTRNQNILDPTLGNYDAFNYSLSLDFTSSAKDSRLFGPTAPAELYDILASQNVTFNSHREGIYPAHFSSNSALSSFYSVLSTNKDRKGKPFVSTIEAFDYPVYGVQWHPEKNRYELNMVNGKPFEDIPHSPTAAFVSQYMANYLGGLARKSSHKFSSSEEESARLIYNYGKTRTGPMFAETYFFPNDF